jgi:hypothetical protein
MSMTKFRASIKEVAAGFGGFWCGSWNHAPDHHDQFHVTPLARLKT